MKVYHCCIWFCDVTVIGWVFLLGGGVFDEFSRNGGWSWSDVKVDWNGCLRHFCPIYTSGALLGMAGSIHTTAQGWPGPFVFRVAHGPHGFFPWHSNLSIVQLLICQLTSCRVNISRDWDRHWKTSSDVVLGFLSDQFCIAGWDLCKWQLPEDVIPWEMGIPL